MILTGRDKVLLFVLVLFIIIVVGGKYMILPMYESYKESKTEAQEVSMQAKSVDLALSSVESEKDNLTETEAEFINIAKDYSEYMNIREITEYINNITTAQGLMIKSFSVTDAEKALGEDSDLFVYTSTISLEVSGPYENIRAFINSAYDNKSLLVMDFDIVNSVETTLEIDLQLFMYDNRWSE